MFDARTTRLVHATTLGTALLLAASPVLAAYEFYVTIEGTKQGKLKGESARQAHAAAMAGLSFEYKLTSPRDAASGQASGKRQHSPVCFTKEWGASSPQLFQAAVTGEVLKSVLFEFVSTDPNGQEQVTSTIKLTNAVVASLEKKTGAIPIQSTKTTAAYDAHQLEEVCLTFQRIEIESKTGKTMAADDWK